MTTAIIEEIEALEVHFFRVSRTPEERKRWLRDYIEDMSDLSPEQVKSACKAWRQSAAKKFPTSGELRRLAPFKAQQTEKLEPWRPLSDEEYDALTIREKIRHHRILTHEAEIKAGPQMKHKRPIERDAMPEAWHFWRGHAANHHAEVSRLLNVLHEARENGRPVE